MKPIFDWWEMRGAAKAHAKGSGPFAVCGLSWPWGGTNMADEPKLPKCKHCMKALERLIAREQ